MKLRNAFGFLFVATVFAGCGDSQRTFDGGVDGSTGGSGGGSAGEGQGGSGASGGNGTGGSGATAGNGTGGSGATAGNGTGGSGATAGSATDGGLDGSAEGGFSCSTDADCDNQNACDGDETCVNSLCQSGTPLDEGDVCVAATEVVTDAGAPDSGADGGDAGPIIARESICHLGQCAPTCEQDNQCNDGNVCNGTETCNPTIGVCQQGSSLACDDSDDCTTNECDPSSGCFYPLIDEDGDGHAPDSLGACGDDCDDADDTTFTGAPELCDSKDNNCEGNVDEGSTPYWYIDCDGDGYAAGTTGAISQCDIPAKPTITQCPGGNTDATWTNREPTSGQADCYDYSADYRPRTASENNTAWGDTAASGAPVSINFDFNCDGNNDDRQYTTTGADSTASCSSYCIGILGQPCKPICSGAQGYTAATSPACGSSGYYTYCGSGCVRTNEYRKQQCR